MAMSSGDKEWDELIGVDWFAVFGEKALASGVGQAAAGCGPDRDFTIC